MAKRLKNHTLDQYLSILSRKQPTPGGGSAAALTGACGVALLLMVANYSLGRSKSKRIENQFKSHISKLDIIRKRLTELVDLDADAYMNVVKARGQSVTKRKAADKQAAKVPQEVGKLCQKAIQSAPLMVEKGNKYLMADVEVAVEMLLAAHNSALILQKQS